MILTLLLQRWIGLKPLPRLPSWSLMDLALTMDFQATNSHRNARELPYSRKIPSLTRHYRIGRLMKSKVTLSRSCNHHGTEEPLRTLVMLNMGSSRPSNGEVQSNLTYWWSFGNCGVVNVQMKIASNACTGENWQRVHYSWQQRYDGDHPMSHPKSTCVSTNII